MPGAVCSGDDGRCQRKSGALVRESFPLVPEPLWDCLGAVPKDRRLVCRILFDAEDGSVVGVNDHIEDLSILDDFNLVLAFFVFVFRLGRGAAHFLFSGAYGLGKSGLRAGHAQGIVTSLCGTGSQGRNSQG